MLRVPYLLTTGKEELVWVNAVWNGAANDRNPVEYERRFIWILEEKLFQYIDEDGDDDEGTGGVDDEKRRRSIGD